MVVGYQPPQIFKGPLFAKWIIVNLEIHRAGSITKELSFPLALSRSSISTLIGIKMNIRVVSAKGDLKIAPITLWEWERVFFCDMNGVAPMSALEMSS